jgi:hypothetical protein
MSGAFGTTKATNWRNHDLVENSPRLNINELRRAGAIVPGQKAYEFGTQTLAVDWFWFTDWHGAPCARPYFVCRCDQTADKS